MNQCFSLKKNIDSYRKNLQKIANFIQSKLQTSVVLENFEMEIAVSFLIGTI